MESVLSQFDESDEAIFGGKEQPISHTIIMRAANPDPGGPCAQIKLTHRGEPDRALLDDFRARLIDAYVDAFGERPERVGVAVLPYVTEYDEDES